MLSGLVRNLNETVQSLWDTVHDLRLERGAVRPAARIADNADPRPPTWRMPPANAALVEQVETLRQQIDALNSDAEYLWSEAQWLRAQLAAFRADVGPPDGPP
jgi:outer membrane murein-binding lipoprotein Lpp